MTFSADGTKMYVAESAGGIIYQYTLSTPWEMAGASYSGVSFDVSGQTLQPLEVVISADGTKMYVTGWDPFEAVYQYSLSTAWNIGSASYSGIAFVFI
jgi:sugar lactone lactonase YvrE